MLCAMTIGRIYLSAELSAPFRRYVINDVLMCHETHQKQNLQTPVQLQWLCIITDGHLLNQQYIHIICRLFYNKTTLQI